MVWEAGDSDAPVFPPPPTCMTYHHLIIHGEYVWT